MARTFNRQPYSVPIPSSKDVKNYFMTQANWKGVIKNNNFLTVDQESFEDAQNIYVDDKFLLKSRPSVKIDETLECSEITDVHTFNNFIVYVSDTQNLLYVVKDGRVVSNFTLNSDYRLLQIEKYVLLFTPNNLYKIDSNGEISKAEIYVPKTTLVGLDGKESDLESKNIFTDDEIIVYLYNGQAINNKNTLLGKNVKIKLNNEYYEFTFTEYTVQSIFKNFLTLSSDNVVYKYSSRPNYKYIPISISSKGTMAYYEIQTHNVYYSTDGVVFNKLLKIPLELRFDNVEIKFAKNNPAILSLLLKHEDEKFKEYTQAGLYFISVESDLPKGELRYPNLTLITTLRLLSKSPSFAFDVMDYDKYVYEYHEKQSPDMSLDSTRYGVYAKYVNGENIKNYYIGAGFYSDFFAITLLTVTSSHLLSVISNGNNNDVIDMIPHKPAFEGENSRQTLSTKTGMYRYESNRDFILYEIDSNKSYLIVNDTIDSLNPNVEDDEYINPIYEIKDNYAYGFDTKSKKYVLSELTANGWDNIDTLTMLTDFYYCGCLIDNQSSEAYLISKYDLSNKIVFFKNLVEETLELEFTKEGDEKYLVPDKVSQLNALYISKNDVLYISNKTDDDTIYFPEINKQSFTSNITNLHPLSENEMGIFLDEEIWYSYITDEGLYGYRKSRLSLGCKNGDDVITTYDGKYTLFNTNRGLAALSYQDFVASTEQTINFISDSIESIYKQRFLTVDVKLCKFDNYIFVYTKSEINENNVLVFDLRTNSWWPWFIPNVDRLFTNRHELAVICGGTICKFDYSSNEYYDNIFAKENINWYLTSQKLHLNANNYDKHIINMTFSAVEDDDSTNPFSMKLNVKNYRHFIDEGTEQSFDYKVELIRTFVKRLNYAKVREFQYTLSTNDENAIKLPLSLSAITIKYKIGGQVR